MSRWSDGIDWFWLGIVLIVVALGAFDAVERQQKNDLIKACISQNKAATFENNEFKECK